MEKRILNNKIGIQIVVIIMGIALLTLGILCSLLQSGNFDGAGAGRIHQTYDAEAREFSFLFDGFLNNDTFCILVGFAIAFVGLAIIVIGSIKLANYVMMKTSLKLKINKIQTHTSFAKISENIVDDSENSDDVL